MRFVQSLRTVTPKCRRFSYLPVSVMLSFKLAYNGLRIGLVRAFKDTSPKFRTKRSDEKLRSNSDIARIRLMRCWLLAIFFSAYIHDKFYRPTLTIQLVLSLYFVLRISCDELE